MDIKETIYTVYVIYGILLHLTQLYRDRRGGPAVAQLVEALRYKPEGRGFDSRWCQRIFFIGIILPVRIPEYRNEYQEYLPGGKGGQCIRLTTYHFHVPTV
jgi:hypothetical protein